MVYPRAVMENGINSRIGYSGELCDMWDSIDYYVKIKKEPDDGIYIFSLTSFMTVQSIIIFELSLKFTINEFQAYVFYMRSSS